jgi:hypothetical protein
MQWGALVPEMVQATGIRSANDSWVEVCRTTGLVWVHSDNGAGLPATKPVPMVKGSWSWLAWLAWRTARNLFPP